MIIFLESSSFSLDTSTSCIFGMYPAFSNTLFVRTQMYCTYGPVSPLKLSIISQSNISSFILLFDKSLNITAPTPTIFATSSLFSKFGFFSSIIFLLFSIASFNKSSSLIMFPSLVDILPVFNWTIPNGMCFNPFVYFSSIPRYLAVANTCLKCKACSYEVKYKALSKSYVLAL